MTLQRLFKLYNVSSQEYIILDNFNSSWPGLFSAGGIPGALSSSHILAHLAKYLRYPSSPPPSKARFHIHRFFVICLHVTVVKLVPASSFHSLRTSNVNDIESKGQTFQYRSLLSERKKNVLVWSAYYRNESKTYWFGPKSFLLRADRFRFGPKILGQSKAIWFVLEIVVDKVERFYLIQKLIDWSKRFWFGLLIIRTKAKPKT